MMLSKADFDELFPKVAPDAIAGQGVVPEQPADVVPLTPPARYARYKMPDPTAAFMRMAMMNTNAMLGTYRRMTGG